MTVWQAFFAISFSIVVLTISIILAVKRYRHAQRILKQWADDHGYTIIDIDPWVCCPLGGPFGPVGRGIRWITRISVRDVDGNERKG